VDAIPAEEAMYLTVKIDRVGRTLADDTVLADAAEVTLFLIRSAHADGVPFYAFGAQRSEPGFRIPVGTLRTDGVTMVFENLCKALSLVGWPSLWHRATSCLHLALFARLLM
jgi:aspartate/methionine/tyrosine aminotransferase